MHTLQTFKKAFDKVLAADAHERVQRFADIVRDPESTELLEHAVHMMLSGGKRVRPYLSYLAATSYGAVVELKSLVGLEYFHTFALIHDDIVDDSALRHGVPSVHAQALIKHDRRVAEGQAVLIGDLLYAWSRESLPHTALAAFDAMAEAVVAGQLLDVGMMGKSVVDAETIRRKTLLKTAHYTFVYPIRIGAALAGKECDQWSSVFGEALGMAFQLQDDLLDVVGTGDELGKPALHDVAQGQHTLLTAHVMQYGSEEDKKLLASCFGVSGTPLPPEETRSLFERTGAVAAIHADIASSFAIAEQSLAQAPFSSSAWAELITLLKARMR